MFRYVVIDHCLVPRALAPAVKQLKAAVPGAVLISCYRGEDAARQLHKLGKHTQGELYDAWRRDPRDNAPANPPGFSSHEGRSDGNAFFRKPRGARIPRWQVGMDWSDQHIAALQSAAARKGWVLSRPYTATSEHHHLNFHTRPR